MFFGLSWFKFGFGTPSGWTWVFKGGSCVGLWAEKLRLVLLFGAGLLGGVGGCSWWCGWFGWLGCRGWVGWSCGL